MWFLRPDHRRGIAVRLRSLGPRAFLIFGPRPGAFIPGSLYPRPSLGRQALPQSPAGRTRDETVTFPHPHSAPSTFPSPVFFSVPPLTSESAKNAGAFYWGSLSSETLTACCSVGENGTGGGQRWLQFGTPAYTIAVRKHFTLVFASLLESAIQTPGDSAHDRRALGLSRVTRGDLGEPLTAAMCRKCLARDEDIVVVVCFFHIFSKA